MFYQSFNFGKKKTCNFVLKQILEIKIIKNKLEKVLKQKSTADSFPIVHSQLQRLLTVLGTGIHHVHGARRSRSSPSAIFKVRFVVHVDFFIGFGVVFVHSAQVFLGQ